MYVLIGRCRVNISTFTQRFLLTVASPTRRKKSHSELFRQEQERWNASYLHWGEASYLEKNWQNDYNVNEIFSSGERYSRGHWWSSKEQHPNTDGETSHRRTRHPRHLPASERLLRHARRVRTGSLNAFVYCSFGLPIESKLILSFPGYRHSECYNIYTSM